MKEQKIVKIDSQQKELDYMVEVLMNDGWTIDNICSCMNKYNTYVFALCSREKMNLKN